MHYSSKLIFMSAVVLANVAIASGANAQSQTYTTKHWANDDGAVSVTLNENVFINHGLVGVGHLKASTRDYKGDTLGSFSGMALRDWKKSPNGGYIGNIYTLPDRGPNDIGGIKGTTEYINRLHGLHLVIDNKGNMEITRNGGILLKDETGKTFTGKDPGANVITRNGINYPFKVNAEKINYEITGHISMDSEAIAMLPDGSFYISDEYAAGIYYFDKTGRQIGAINTVPALMPIKSGVVNFTAESAPDSGRRNNQGLEALAITPNGKHLVTILQSATIQDTAGKNAATRNNTRILVYDISKKRTPTQPIAHYVLQLPTYRENGDGNAADATAAQSEMLALSDSQFLVLARDGNGRGKGNTNAAVFKSVLLVDTNGATNLAGTIYEQIKEPIAKNGILVDGINPVKQAEFINMLNPLQLAKFGINLNVSPSNAMTLPEKLEAMAIAPVLDPKAPNDVFLLVGSDNDFITEDGYLNGKKYDAGLKDANSGKGDNESIILVYRLTLPKNLVQH